jgi:hypothetical protein
LSQQDETMTVPTINLAMAWLWMLAGFLSGMLLGLGFHDEKWLGGYASHRRRLYRLGHISFFGLGIVNLAFYVTVRLAGIAGARVDGAAAAFVIGAMLMPACCVLMAHFPKTRMLFAAPVISLMSGAVLVLMEVL